MHKAASSGSSCSSELVDTHAELVQVQAHGGDSSADEDPALFFLPHRPFGQDGKPAQPLFPPLFLLMKGSDWRGSGAGDAQMPTLALVVSGKSAPTRMDNTLSLLLPCLQVSARS